MTEEDNYVGFYKLNFLCSAPSDEKKWIGLPCKTGLPVKNHNIIQYILKTYHCKILDLNLFLPRGRIRNDQVITDPDPAKSFSSSSSGSATLPLS